LYCQSILFSSYGSAKHVSSEQSAGSSAAGHSHARDREHRQRAARIKRLIYGASFSGIPMLRQIDIATPAYWLYSAALVSNFLLLCKCDGPFAKFAFTIFLSDLIFVS
jgi:hypothetical protein